MKQIGTGKPTECTKEDNVSLYIWADDDEETESKAITSTQATTISLGTNIDEG
jgi:hypothetical protein